MAWAKREVNQPLELENKLTGAADTTNGSAVDTAVAAEAVDATKEYKAEIAIVAVDAAANARHANQMDHLVRLKKAGSNNAMSEAERAADNCHKSRTDGGETAPLRAICSPDWICLSTNWRAHWHVWHYTCG